MSFQKWTQQFASYFQHNEYIDLFGAFQSLRKISFLTDSWPIAQKIFTVVNASEPGSEQ